MSDTIEYQAYFERYIAQSNGNSPSEAFANQQGVMSSFLSAIDEERSLYAYAPGKWTLREMLQHLIDAERIFVYRALCIARGEAAILPGFEEDEYVITSNANARTWASLSDEMRATRLSTELLVKSFDAQMCARVGRFSATEGSPHQLGLIIAGHFQHHVAVAERLYAVSLT